MAGRCLKHRPKYGPVNKKVRSTSFDALTTALTAALPAVLTAALTAALTATVTATFDGYFDCCFDCFGPNLRNMID